MKASRNSLVLFVIFLSVAIHLVSCKRNSPTQAPLDSASWAKDIDYFDSQFKKFEYGFTSITSPQAFDSALSNIKISVDTLQNYEIYIKLRQLLASLNVAHIGVGPPSSWGLHFLPIRIRIFQDGVYIIMAGQSNVNLLGKKITSVGGMPIQTVEDSLAKVISHENNYWLEDQLPYALSCVEFLKYYSFTSSLGSVDFDIDGVGKVTVASIEQTTSTPWSLTSVLKGKPIPLYMQNSSMNYWFTYLQANHLLYIKYNSCEEMTNKSFDEFTGDIEDSINSNQVGKVVIDFRNNGGGNSDLIDHLLSYLRNSSLNRTGKLFVVTDRGTFSSASMDAIWFKQRTNCMLVGEPTGGKPNSYGEVLTFMLPNSRLTVQYCTNYFHQMDGDPAALFPDVDIETSAQDFMNGNDPVLNFILNYN